MSHFKLAAAACTLLCFTPACTEGGGAAGTIASELNFFRIARDAEKKYPNLPAPEARKRYAYDIFRDAVAAAESDERKQAIAASFYAGFSGLNYFAIPAYCAEMNVDIAEYRKGFERMNGGEEKALDVVLQREGTTREALMEKQKRFTRSAAKNELLRAGGLQGSYAVCSDVKNNPAKYIANSNFSMHFPTIAATLLKAR